VLGQARTTHDVHRDRDGQEKCGAHRSDAHPDALARGAVAKEADGEGRRQREHRYQPSQFYHFTATFRSVTPGLSGSTTPTTTAASAPARCRCAFRGGPESR